MTTILLWELLIRTRVDHMHVRVSLVFHVAYHTSLFIKAYNFVALDTRVKGKISTDWQFKFIITWLFKSHGQLLRSTEISPCKGLDRSRNSVFVTFICNVKRHVCFSLNLREFDLNVLNNSLNFVKSLQRFVPSNRKWSIIIHLVNPYTIHWFLEATITLITITRCSRYGSP